MSGEKEDVHSYYLSIRNKLSLKMFLVGCAFDVFTVPFAIRKLCLT
jgi:hypothetical protein